jgi:predicted PhzF superfamily epimerase YddE/YHI9
VQECGVGLVEVRVDDDALAFGAPAAAARRAADGGGTGRSDPGGRHTRERVDRGDPRLYGPGWRLLRLESAEQVLAARPVAEAPVPTDVGLIGPRLPGAGADFELRAFFSNPQGKIVEDSRDRQPQRCRCA